MNRSRWVLFLLLTIVVVAGATIACSGSSSSKSGGKAAGDDDDTALGACCYDGVCASQTRAACSAEWQGAGTDCADNPCSPTPSDDDSSPDDDDDNDNDDDATPPLGACCQGAACAVKPYADCAGSWMGADTICVPNPCVDDDDDNDDNDDNDNDNDNDDSWGACCQGEYCLSATETRCGAMGGAWHGGEVCAGNPNPCGFADGACCAPISGGGDECIDTTSSACSAITGGQYVAGAPCSQLPCSWIGGACCGNGECYDGTDQAGCQTQGGTFFNEQTCAAVESQCAAQQSLAQ
jgi:hypothetical protein